MKTNRFGWDPALDKIYDYSKPIAGTFESYHDLWEVLELLNELQNENEYLKAENDRIYDTKSDLDYYKTKCASLEKENKKLKEFLSKLYLNICATMKDTLTLLNTKR